MHNVKNNHEPAGTKPSTTAMAERLHNAICSGAYHIGGEEGDNSQICALQDALAEVLNTVKDEQANEIIHNPIIRQILTQGGVKIQCPECNLVLDSDEIESGCTDEECGQHGKEISDPVIILV